MTRKKRALYRKAVWCHFNGEARRIGSGARPVIVLSIGPKWVRLKSPSNGFVARIGRVAWDNRKEIGRSPK